MITFRLVRADEKDTAMAIINTAKAHLKAQGVDQWQKGYPDEACIEGDIAAKKAYFIVEEEAVLGYVCVDFDGEPAYNELKGTWNTPEEYVVLHRMAFTDNARGKGISSVVFRLVEALSIERGVHACRVDTDGGNAKMKHILKKNGFLYCGTIWFDNSEKIAFDKSF